MLNQLKEAANWISKRIERRPEVGMILGSGLSEAFSKIEDKKVFSQSEVPGFPTPSVKGHTGGLICGSIAEKDVLIQQGRIHWYEGQPMDMIAFSVRVMSLMDIETLFITNAAGGINENFEPGDLVSISDHINSLGLNPLRGPNLDELGPRFPDLSDAYSKKLRKIARKAADRRGIKLKEGIYVMTPGPSYETPAEIRAFGKLGADLVGMSTVPEVIAANHCGMKVAAISCITNKAAGLQSELAHEEVIETTERVKGELAQLMEEIMGLI